MRVFFVLVRVLGITSSRGAEGRASARKRRRQLVHGIGTTYSFLPRHALLADVDEGHVARVVGRARVLLDASHEAGGHGALRSWRCARRAAAAFRRAVLGAAWFAFEAAAPWYRLLASDRRRCGKSACSTLTSARGRNELRDLAGRESMGVALVGKVARRRSTSGRGTGSDRSRRHGSVEDSRTGIGRVVSSVSVEIGTLPDAALVAEHEERKLAAAMGPRARAAKLRNAAKRKKYAEQDDYVQAAPAASVERDVGDLVARVIDVAGDDRAGAVTSASPPRSTIQAPAARLSSAAPPSPPPRTPPVVIVAEVAAPVVAAPAPSRGRRRAPRRGNDGLLESSAGAAHVLCF